MKILLIENEEGISKFIKQGLEAEMCIVETAFNGAVGVSLSNTNTYDVIILDFNLPDMNGNEIAALIRQKKPSVPILVLSVESNMDIKLDMLSTCDDYMTKPFSLRELIVRLRALNRRGEVKYGNILKDGDLGLDSEKYVVKLNDKVIPRRNKEFTLLEYLMRNQDIVLSREMMLEYVWDMNTDPFTNTVDTHIRLLRKKIEDKKHTFIKTVPKRGYCFSIS